MESPILFLFGVFGIIFLGREIAEFLKIPVLTVYIVFGIVIGPYFSGIIKEVESLKYFYHLGIIFLMFSSGFGLKLTFLKENKKKLILFHFLNGWIPGIVGFFVGLVINNLSGHKNLFLPLALSAIFISSSVGIIIPLFSEFTSSVDRKTKNFTSIVIGGTVLNDILSLFLISFIITFKINSNLKYIYTFIIFTVFYFVIIFKLFPYLYEKIFARIKKISILVEEQTRVLVLFIIFAVYLGELFKIHPVISSFVVGISLANSNINRKTLHILNFITYSIFVPLFFTTIGAEMDLSIFKIGKNYLYPILISLSLILSKFITGFISAKISNFENKKSVGFGFSTIPQLSATIAAGFVCKELGIFNTEIFNSVIILSVVTTFLGPVIVKNIFSSKTKHPGKFESILSFIHQDIKAIPDTTPFSKILKMIQNSEMEIHPVVDQKNFYKGVINISDIKNIVFDEEFDRLIIASDITDRSFPYVFIDDSINTVIETFRNTKVYVLPVVESIEEGNIYVGVIFLRDILPSFF